jgi:hypothetical protein
MGTATFGWGFSGARVSLKFSNPGISVLTNENQTWVGYYRWGEITPLTRFKFIKRPSLLPAFCFIQFLFVILLRPTLCTGTTCQLKSEVEWIYLPHFLKWKEVIHMKRHRQSFHRHLAKKLKSKKWLFLALFNAFRFIRLIMDLLSN